MDFSQKAILERIGDATEGIEVFRAMMGRDPDPHIFIPAYVCDLLPTDNLPYDYRTNLDDNFLIVVDTDFHDPHEAEVAASMTRALHRAQEHQETCLKCRDRTFVATRLTEVDWCWLVDNDTVTVAAAIMEALFARAIGARVAIGFQ